jgi:hypothetical protein
MPESGTYGSVRGAPSNGRPYRNALPVAVRRESQDLLFAATVRGAKRSDCGFTFFGSCSSSAVLPSIRRGLHSGSPISTFDLPVGYRLP